MAPRGAGATLLALIGLSTHILETEAAAFDLSSLEPDLRCSACTNFATDLWSQHKRTSAAGLVYRDRLRAIYTAHNPSKLGTVDSLLRRSAGQEYELYLKVCRKYNLEPEDPDEPTAEQSEQAVEVALAGALAGLDRAGAQWAVMGDPGSRQYIDFNNVMRGGSISGSISMGADTHQHLSQAYRFFATEHKESVVQSIEQSTSEAAFKADICRRVAACQDGGREL